MLNQCSFIGHLGADPESRSFQSGGKVCNLRLAVTEKWKDKNGERKEATEWISVSVFNEGLAGVCEQYLRKGSKIYVTGKWKTRKWQDQSGNDRYSTECVLQGPQAQLVMLDSPGDQRGEGKKEYGGDRGGGAWGDDLDDDIAF